MSEQLILNQPEMMEQEMLLIVGTSKRYTSENVSQASRQWSDFKGKMGSIPNAQGHTMYGVCYNYDDQGNMDYLSGIEVENIDEVPEHMTHVRVEPQTYAKFEYDGPINKMDEAWAYIFEVWMPENGERFLAGQPMLERYGTDFDPESMTGLVEIFIPLH